MRTIYGIVIGLLIIVVVGIGLVIYGTSTNGKINDLQNANNALQSQVAMIQQDKTSASPTSTPAGTKAPATSSVQTVTVKIGDVSYEGTLSSDGKMVTLTTTGQQIPVGNNKAVFGDPNANTFSSALSGGSSVNFNGWAIKLNQLIDNDPIVKQFMSQLKKPDPANWKSFPNVPNKDVPSFNVQNGAEYGMADSPFCQQDSRCDFVVPAREYRLITADYQFQDMSCDSNDGKGGCLLLIVNVGDQSYTWRNQMSDNGFTVHGRYWNGDKLDQAIWGLVSHASANMLNMPTSAHPGESLNFGSNGANGGANCGSPNGCKVVRATVVIVAVNRIIALAQTTVGN